MASRPFPHMTGTRTPSADALVDMVRWEYLIVALPTFEDASSTKGHSRSVEALNAEGALGWEAFGMTPLADGSVCVILKRPLAEPSQ